jgi:hypothetical protein
VDALHFDGSAQHGVGSRPQARQSGQPAGPAPLATSRSPAALRELREALRRHAERGVSGVALQQWAGPLEALQRRAGDHGLSVLAALSPGACRAGEFILRMNFVSLQYDQAFGAAEDPAITRSPPNAIEEA